MKKPTPFWETNPFKGKTPPLFIIIFFLLFTLNNSFSQTTFTSNGTGGGNWNQVATWDHGSLTPVPGDKIIILSGDVVNMTENQIWIVDVTIHGTLNHNGFRLYINGIYINNGIHAGTGRFYHYGDTVGGTGTITFSTGGSFAFLQYNKIILPNSNLTITDARLSIYSDITVTNYGTIECYEDIRDMQNGCTWINAANSTLICREDLFTTNNTATLTASASGNTVEYNSDAARNIYGQGTQYYNLVVSGADIKTLTENVIVHNDLTISSTLNGGGNDIYIAGDWTNTGTFTSTGTAIFNGTADQTISNALGESFYDFTINKASGTLTSSYDLSVINILQFTAGNISMGINMLTLGTGAGTPGTIAASPDGWVVGYFERWITATTAYTFPVGTESDSRYADITFNNISNGTAICRFTETSPGNNGLPLKDGTDSLRNTFNDGYWELAAANSISTTDFDLALTGTNMDAFTIDGATSIVKRDDEISDWGLNGTHTDASGSTAYRDNLTSFAGHYAFADTNNCSLPSTSVITGSTSVCKSDAGETYSVTGSNTYEWTITSGVANPASTSNSVNVDWGATGTVGVVKVKETSSCGTGEAVTLDVNINAIPTSSIIGLTTVVENQTGVTYTVTSNSGYSYDWDITGGAITAGEFTNSCTVTWGSTGTGNISVIATHGVCSDAAAAVNADISISTEIVSTQTGDWNVTSTWVGGVVPTSTSNVRIANGDTVTLTANRSCYGLTIDDGAMFDHDANVLTLGGNYVNNGYHTTNSNNTNRFYLDGNNTNISGTGLLTDDNNQDLRIMRIRVGNKTILSTTDLTIMGDMYIEDDITVTNNGKIYIHTNLEGGNDFFFTQGPNAYLSVGNQILDGGNETLNASATGNTVVYNSGGGERIKTPSSNTYYNLIISGSDDKDMRANLIILGDLTINSILDPTNNDYDISIAGNWINNGSFVERNAIITFNGTSDQTMTNGSGETFYDFTVNKTGGSVILTSDLIVENDLTMTQGNINTGSNIITVGISTANRGTLNYSSGSVIGKYEKWFNGGGNHTLPLGTADDYRPLRITFNDAATGTLIGSFLENDPTNNGLYIIDTDSVFNTFSEGYWTISGENTLSSSDYDVELTGTGFTSFSLIAKTRVLTRENNISDWEAPGTHTDLSGSTAYRNSVNVFPAEFALGDTSSCGKPSTSAITGDQDVCKNESGVAYSVTNNVGNSYNWEITGGSVASGQGTNSITVNWLGTGMVGNVRCTESTNCGAGAPADLSVDINAFATSTISGAIAVSENETASTYSVINRTGYSYDWFITGGTQQTGGTSNSITLDWGAAGSGKVTCLATHGGCAETVDSVHLSVTKYAEFVSKQSGDWNVGSTWVGGVAPSNSLHNVRIAADDTVTLTVATTINNFKIETDGMLFHDDNNFYVDGDYYNDGYQCIGRNRERFFLDGRTTIIDGTGTIDGDSTINPNTATIFRVRDGNKTILSSSSLTINGDVRIDDDIQVLNNGTITIMNDIHNGIWKQGENSIIYLHDEILTDDLYASATGNKFYYLGTYTGTNIEVPVNDEYYDIYLSGPNNKDLTGDLVILNDLTIEGDMDMRGTPFNIEIKGDWINNGGNFVRRTSTITFSGTTDQTITYAAGEIFYNLTINKPSGIIILADNVTVTNQLTMIKGNINTGTDKISVGSGTGASRGTLSHTSGTIIGKYEKWCDQNNAYTFPVGTSSSYRPAIIDFGNQTGGTVISEFKESSPGVQGLWVKESATTDTVYNAFSEGYWILTKMNGLTSTSFDLDLIGNDMTSFTIATDSRIISRVNNTSDWELYGTHVNASGSTVQRDNIDQIYAEYAIGDNTNCTPTITSVITGDDEVCRNENAVAYSVTDNGNTYDWTITGGTQAGGGSTASITVNWLGTGMQGNVRVIETDACGSGTPVDLPVSINAMPTSSVSGQSTVTAGISGISYTVTDNSGYSYDWTITGGTQASGGTTNSITVDWNSTPGAGLVEVIATHTACSDAATLVDLSITKNDVIESFQDGQWDVGSTWVGGTVPLSTDNVKINATHTVTIDSDVEANDIEIVGTVQHDAGNDNLEIYGNYTNNGAHNVIDNDDFNLRGLGKTINGTGTINITNSERMRVLGNYTIAASTNLTITGDLRIGDTYVVTNNGTIIITDDLLGNGANAHWINAASSSLDVGDDIMVTGKLTASASNNTVTYSSTNGANVKTPEASTYYNLVIEDGGDKDMTGALIISGDLSIATATDLTTTGADYDISIAGNWTNAGTFDEQQGTVTFNGNADQTIINATGETYYDFTVNKASGTLIMAGNVNCDNSITMTKGDINADTYTITLGTSGAAADLGTMTYTSGAIIGKYKKWMRRQTLDNYTLPVGVADYDRPALITLNSNTDGTLLTEFNTGTPGNNGLSLTDGGEDIYNTYSDGYWTMTAGDGLSPTSYDLELTGNGMFTFTIRDVTRLLTRVNSAAAWVAEGSHAAADLGSNIVKRTGITTLSAEYAWGDTSDCTIPNTSVITGASNSLCESVAGVSYSVVDNPPNTYLWTITGGTQASGTTTNAIIVNWGATGIAGNVRVVEQSSCGNGNPVDYAVSVHAKPISSISGNTDVTENETGVIYSVTDMSGYVYKWEITGGTQTAGTTTNSIVVTWNSQGAGNVRCRGSYAGCSDDSTTIENLAITINGEFVSTQTGNWTDGSTWVGGIVPSTLDNARIASTHTVTLTGETFIKNFTIDAGGTLDHDLKILYISGNYTNNGSQEIGDINDALRLTGAGTTIDGSGVIEITSSSTERRAIRIYNNDKTISSSCNLTVKGEFYINSGITVTNNGSITIEDDLLGESNTATWTQGNSSSLTVGDAIFINDIGTLNASATDNTVTYNSSGVEEIITPSSSTYYNLTISGALTKALVSDLTISGDINTNSILSADTFSITLKGDWINTGTFNGGIGDVIFSGTADQSVNNSSGESFTNIIVNKTTGTLNVLYNATVEDTLTMTAGNISVSSGKKLILGTATTDEGLLSYTAGNIIGQFERWIGNTSTDFDFPVGTSANNRNARINFANLGTGSLICEFSTTLPSNNGLEIENATDSVYNTFTEGYWALTVNNSLSSNDYNLGLFSDGMTSFTTGTNTRLVYRDDNISDWELNGTHADLNNDTVKRVNMTIISAEYAIADTNDCTIPVTSVITGDQDVCTSDAGDVYSVSFNATSSYVWVIDSGSCVATCGTNSIQVDWDANGGVGQVQVTESNSCGSAAPVTLAVNVHALPTSVITGTTPVTVGAADVAYSVTNNADYTYTWAITGGTKDAGGTTNSITVDWNSTPGAGEVAVTATHTGGDACGATTQVTLAITKNGEIVSTQTGDWDVGTTWVGGAVPISTDNVRIAATHTVSLTQTETCNNLQIDATGILQHSSNILNIDGNYTNNGTEITGDIDDVLRLNGTGTTIDGSGKVYVTTGGIINRRCPRIYNGSKTISSSANLTFHGEFYIGPGLIVTNNGTVSISSDLIGEDNDATWTQGANSSVSVSGFIFNNNGRNLNATASGNTVIYNSAATGNIQLPISDSSYYNLTINGAGAKTMTGSLTILNDLSISGTLNPSIYNLEIQGNWTNTGSFTEGSTDVTFNSSADQTITNTLGETFYDLTIDKASGELILANDVTASNTLNMTLGNINTGSNKIILGTGTGNIGTLAYTAGIVLGNFEKWINATATGYTFPIGTSTDYRPAVITFNNLNNGSVIGKFISTAPGSNGLSLKDGADSVHNTHSEGYWTLTTANAISSTDYDLELTGTNMSSFTITGGTRILTRANTITDWSANGTHVIATGSTAERSSMTNLSAQYALGDTNDCNVAITSLITGSTSECTGATPVAYSVTNNSNTYTWDITGGTVASGQGNSSINVTWLGTPMTGNISIIETNACGDGAAVDLDVTLNPIPTSVITGSTSVIAGKTGVAYSVTNNTGFTYTWTIVGGTKASGGTTNSITVDWNSTVEIGTVKVDASHACGSSAQVTLDVTKNGEIVSTQTGDWDLSTTWVGGIVPTSFDNARIANTHTVTLTQDQSINAIKIDAGAILNHNFNVLTVNSDYTNNGYHSTGNAHDKLLLKGNGATIDGSGILEAAAAVSDKRVMYIHTGTKTIASTAYLTIKGQCYIASDITITNDGYITITGNLVGENTNSTWTQGNNSTLICGGTIFNDNTRKLSASADGNTVKYQSTSSHDIQTPSSSNTYYNLTIDGSGTKSLSGSLIVLGDLSIASTFSAGSNNINLSGNWTNTGAFTSGTGEVIYDGSGNQTITTTASLTYYDMRTNKSSGSLTLAGDIVVSNTLTMSQGDITTGSNKITLGISTATIGTLSRTSGSVIGQYEKWVNSTGLGYTLPVGVSTDYRPALITFTNLVNGSIISEFIDTDPGSSGLSLKDGTDSVHNPFTEGYWAITAANSLSSNDYNLELTGTGMACYTFRDRTRLITRANDASAWTVIGTHVNGDIATNTAKRANITTLSAEYAFGDTTRCIASSATPTITGSASVCQNISGEAYSVTNNAPNTYTWTILGGTKASGGTTNAIAINWLDSGMVGNVKVIENSSCGYSPQATINVNIHAIPTSAISGAAIVDENQNGVSYSVTNNADYTYAWTITGGTQASGTNTNSITVNWGSFGSGNIKVIATNTTCSDASAAVNLPITINSTYLTTTSGDWNVGSTWVGGSAPFSTSGAHIQNGHTVTLTQVENIVNLEIDAGGTLDHANTYLLTVNGDYINNGTENIGTGDDLLKLAGNGTAISGTGAISISTESNTAVRISNGDKNILSGTSLTVDGTFFIENNLSITNSGTITINNDLEAAGPGTPGVSWTNANGSTLNIKNTIFSVDGTLTASAATNTVNYFSADNEDIKEPTGETYYNLIIGGGNTKTATSGLIISGDLDVSSTLDMGNNDLSITGNCTNSGTLTSGSGVFSVSGTLSNTGAFSSTGTVIFSGSNAKSTDNPMSFDNLTLSISGADFTMNDTIVVDGTLTLSNGKIILGANNLTLTANSSLSGGNSGSYIVADNTGFIRQSFDAGNKTTPLSIPMGDATNYSPVTFKFNSATLGAGAEIQFNLTDAAHSQIDTSHKYITRFWTFHEVDITNPDYNMSLTYVDGDVVGGDEASLIFSKYSGGLWTSGGSCNPATNKISWNNITSFSEGTGEGEIGLPITLAEFDAFIIDGIVYVKWTTAAEINNDYFDVERSSDGLNFEQIKRINGAGNSHVLLDYSAKDKKPHSGISYYRLKQTDYDGQYTYSKTVSVTNFKSTDNKKSKSSIDLFPDPITDGTLNIVLKGYVPGETITIIISNIQGRKIHKENLNIEFDETFYQLEVPQTWDSGLYILTIKSDDKIDYKKFVVQ